MIIDKKIDAILD